MSEPINEADQQRLKEIVDLMMTERVLSRQSIEQLIDIAYHEGYFRGKLTALEDTLKRFPT